MGEERVGLWPIITRPNKKSRTYITLNPVPVLQLASRRRPNSSKRFSGNPVIRGLGFGTLSKEAKRVSGDMKGIDRLSDLPDSILHHILSFLDTKSSVQTCILSRRWRCVWKHVHVLTFSKSSSGYILRFQRLVEKVLFLRYDSCSVSRVAVKFWAEEMVRIKDQFDTIMRYAASHGVRELFVRSSSFTRLVDVVEPVCKCCQTLKVLELKRTCIQKADVRLWSCLQLLESLTLTKCELASADETDDAFANLPVLKSLRLVRCSYSNCFGCETSDVLRVTGSKLLNLEIVQPQFDNLQIVAPNLQSLSIETDPVDVTLVNVYKSNLPSLNRADIKLLGNWHPWFDSSDVDYEKQMLLELCANLFKILHNVQALDLQVDTFELLIQTCGSVEHRASPFKRMKFLNLKCCR